MKKIVVSAFCAIGFLLVALGTAGSALAQSSPEDRYIATRDAAIRKLKPLYDAGPVNDAVVEADDAARADLEGQLRTILGPLGYNGFDPGRLNLNSLYDGDEDFGALDGLRFSSKIGTNGEPAGGKDANGNYVEPKSHIVVTTQSLFARWLRTHKDWWDKGVKNVPQQMGAALNDEDFYSEVIPTGAAVVKFDSLPIAKPAAATFTYAVLVSHTQSEVPKTAGEFFASALARNRLYIAHGSIAPGIEIAACDAIWDDHSPHGEKAFKRCFAEHAAKQPAFAEATKQAQALLETALGQ
jgi:hypothetical protein